MEEEKKRNGNIDTEVPLPVLGKTIDVIGNLCFLACLGLCLLVLIAAWIGPFIIYFNLCLWSEKSEEEGDSGLEAFLDFLRLSQYYFGPS